MSVGGKESFHLLAAAALPTDWRAVISMRHPTCIGGGRRPDCWEQTTDH
jgi:hypothetical protein